MATGGPRHAVIYGANFALATVSALFVPASAALIKERVRSRGGSTRTTRSRCRPGLSASIGGFAVQWFGTMPLFVFNAGTFLASAVCVFAMGCGPSRPAPVFTVDRPDTPGRVEVPARTGRLILLYAQCGIVVAVFNFRGPDEPSWAGRWGIAHTGYGESRS